MRAADFRRLLDSLPALTPRQRDALESALGSGDAEAVRVLLARLADATPDCPHCGGDHVIGWGSAAGLPRWRCKGCGRTFNPLSQTSLARLRKRDRWAAFVRSMEMGETLEEAAERCGIHRNTAHRWRHRFLRQPQRTRERISGIAEADETFVLRSAKGQPRIRKQWRRKPRRRGGHARFRGRSHEHVRVFVARDRGGSTLERVYRRFDARRLRRLLEDSLAPDAILCTDGLGTYRALARDLGVRHEPVINAREGRVREVFHIQNVNSYHSRWKSWMRRFRGVSTLYLRNYLAWFRTLDTKPKHAAPNFMLHQVMPA
jgi:transposase-like protein